jgi:WD domain, G-beta repeat
MTWVPDGCTDLRLGVDSATGVPRLFRGDGQAATPGAVFVRPAGDGHCLEAWLQVRDPLPPGAVQACCYVFDPPGRRWAVRDARFAYATAIPPGNVPAAVRTACEAFLAPTGADRPERPAPAPPPAPPPAPRPPQPERPGLAEEELARFEGHRYWIECVAFSPDGRYVLSGSGQPVGIAERDFDFSVRLWDVATGRQLRDYPGHTNWVTAVAFAPDGRRVLSGSYDQTLRLWDMESGRLLRVLAGHTERVKSVAFAPDGRRAVSGGYDRTVRLWDCEAGREVGRYRGHGHWVLSVAFAPDGRHVLSGGYDRSLRLWRVPRKPAGWLAGLGRLVRGGGEVRRFLGHAHAVTGVAFCPDGRFALSGSTDRTLRLWDVRSGAEVRTLRGHTLGVTGVAVSPDGRHALSGGLDGTVRLWELATGQEVRRFQGHEDVVTCVAFAPNGRCAISGGADRRLRLWKLP